MQFFTRELYVEFNSRDAELADAADASWERAAGEYRRHLRRALRGAPLPVRKLSKLCLHDAEMIRGNDPFLIRLPQSGLIGVGIKVTDDLWRAYLISYALRGSVRETTRSTEWPFSRNHVRWLYDELDTGVGKHHFIHRILLSDGRIVAIPFTNVGIQQMTLHAESLAEVAAQPA